MLIRACGLHVEETALDALFQKESAARKCAKFEANDPPNQTGHFCMSNDYICQAVVGCWFSLANVWNCRSLCWIQCAFWSTPSHRVWIELNNLFRDCPSCSRAHLMFAVNSAVLKTQCRVLIKLPMKTVSQLDSRSCQLATASADASTRPKLFGPRTGTPFSPFSRAGPAQSASPSSVSWPRLWNCKRALGCPTNMGS